MSTNIIITLCYVLFCSNINFDLFIWRFYYLSQLYRNEKDFNIMIGCDVKDGKQDGSYLLYMYIWRF